MKTLSIFFSIILILSVQLVLAEDFYHSDENSFQFPSENTRQGFKQDATSIKSKKLTDPGPILNDMRISGDREEDFGTGGVFLAPPLFYETSEYMYGDISVAIILPESNGSIDPSTEDWTQQEIDNVYAEIQDGLDWWITNKHDLAEVNFIIHEPLVLETSYEPINRSSYLYDETLWVGDVMGQLGYSDPNHFISVRYYDDDLRIQDNTDWAFTIFVVDSSNDDDGSFTDYHSAYSYLQGPFSVMTYDNSWRGIDNMDSVTAHETGHIFGALDEYSPCSCTQEGGFLNVENQNCNNNCLINESSIMKDIMPSYLNDLIDYYAQGQIGWRDLNENGIIDCIDADYNADDDSDNDGIVDYWDTCTDSDNDGYGDPGFESNTCDVDNCPNTYNPDQENPDGDYKGSACDNCPDHYNPNQADFDGDELGDVCDDCTDTDGDSYGNPGFPNSCEEDNCPEIANPSQANSDSDSHGDACDNCLTTPNVHQFDNYPPPSGNGIGDACECEADFNCDGNVDAGDVTDFLADFGRNQYNDPCTSGNPCDGDFNCDTNVDSADVTKFLEDFGRNQYNNQCPACEVGEWCEYALVQPRYLIDDIAGDGGKNFPIPQLITLNAGSTTCVDIYLADADENSDAGGVWLDFTSSTADISYVSAGRALTDGSEGVTGPWSPISGSIVNEPAGPGTLMMTVFYYGVPDEDGDIIAGQVCLRHDSINDATINITTILGVATWYPINDEDIIPGLFVIQQ